MLGALIGDIAGSRFEWNNIKTKDFELLTAIGRCRPTDDSIMSLAVAKAILNCNGDYTHLDRQAVSCMQELGRKYPNAGYGGKFHRWIYADDPRPYNSYGNGAAMRVSPAGFAASSLEEAISLARAVTRVTHNHPEGMKAAEAVSTVIYMARSGKSMLEIRDFIESKYYKINFTLDSIRPTYSFDVTCQGSVPQAFEAFFESTGFEDAIRNAISIGGDSDTIAAITGSMAEAYYGIPNDLRKLALTFLDKTQLDILNAFEAKFGMIVEKNVSKDVSRPVSFMPEKKAETEDRQQSMFDAMDAADQAQHSIDIVSRETTANQLYNHLFEACNILRGPIDQDDYKSYVIPILFFKRLSDVYDEETADNVQKYGEDIDLYPEEELHAFVIPEGCQYDSVNKLITSPTGWKSSFDCFEGEGIAGWTAHGNAGIRLGSKHTLNRNRKRALEVDFNGGYISNDGFNGVPIECGKAYRFYIFAKCSYPASLKIMLTSAGGEVYTSKVLKNIGSDYKRFDTELISPVTDCNARLSISSDFGAFSIFVLSSLIVVLLSSSCCLYSLSIFSFSFVR